MARLKDRYNDEIRAALVEQVRVRPGHAGAEAGQGHAQHGRGRGQAGRQDARGREGAARRPSPASSRTSAAPASRSPRFKLREGMPVGLAVTLRDERAYEFLDRLTSVAIPRIRDFRGLNPRSFDGRGNYSWASASRSSSRRSTTTPSTRCAGLDVTITTTARPTPRRSRSSTALGLPFAREGRPAGFESARRRPGRRVTRETLDDHGQDLPDRRATARAQVQDARALALPSLRSSARGLPQVRHLPDVPARARRTRASSPA